MSKCGKGCMPECEYFTTGGCISPFNCPYKIETRYINSATSIPTYMEQYNRMSDDDIESCLERLSTCKATDVMNFDYSATLAYIKRLKAENAALKKRLGKAVELPCIEPMTTWDWDDITGLGKSNFGKYWKVLYRDEDGEFMAYMGATKAEAEAMLEELKGEQK